MALDRIVRDTTINVAQRSMSNIQGDLRVRCAALQEHVDAEGLKWATGIPLSIYSLETALTAATAYDMAWFKSRLWSKPVKAKVALALIDACASYPTVNIHLWKTIARRGL